MKLPGAHFQHSGMPVWLPYVPGGHGKHSARPSKALWNPLPHSTQASKEEAPATAFTVPAGHAVHSAIASWSP